MIVHYDEVGVCVSRKVITSRSMSLSVCLSRFILTFLSRVSVSDVNTQNAQEKGKNPKWSEQLIWGRIQKTAKLYLSKKKPMRAEHQKRKADVKKTPKYTRPNHPTIPS